MIGNKICIQCGKEFSKPPHCGNQQWDDRKYCSQKCYGNFKRNIFVKNHMEGKICPICMNTFYMSSGYSALQWENKKYCSKKCWGISRRGTELSYTTKEKMSISHVGLRCGKENNLFGRFDKDSPVWKGGRKLAMKRSDVKRRAIKKLFGHIFLNTCENINWVGHHLDYNYILFIPKELHDSIRHSVVKNKNMDIINDKIYEWFLDYYLGGTS